MRKQRKSDDDIAVMLKNKLVEMIDGAKDVASIVALTNAFAKLRGVELKADEGSWGEDLPNEASPAEELMRVARQ